MSNPSVWYIKDGMILDGDRVILHILDLVDESDAKRIVDCVNACFGMSDPVKEISDLISSHTEILSALKEANEETKLYEGHPGRWAERIKFAEKLIKR